MVEARGRLLNETARSVWRDAENKTGETERNRAMNRKSHERRLYARHRDDTVIKWKDSIKKVVGIERPTEKGLDV
jgi:hypothetical protein